MPAACTKSRLADISATRLSLTVAAACALAGRYGLPPSVSGAGLAGDAGNRGYGVCRGLSFLWLAWTPGSWLRELMSSLVKTLCRWYSTVRGLMNSWASQRCGACDAEPAGPLRRSHPMGQLEQGQRVAAGLGDDPVPDPLVQPTGDDRGQQRSRVRIDQSL